MANTTITLSTPSELAKSFFNSFKDFDHNGDDDSYYLFIGKCQPWGSPDHPSSVSNTEVNLRDVKSEMISGKRITAAMTRMVVPRVRWANNTPYTAFDDSLSYYPANTYVITSENKVFLCIDNANNANSIAEPRDTTSVFLTEADDGYVWKYLYKIDSADNLFLTTDWMPVPTIQQNDCEVIPGTVSRVVISTVGNAYQNGNTSLVFTGDGIGASYSANVTNTSFSYITVNDRGSGYTNVTVSLLNAEGTGAAFRAILSPVYGHGFEPWRDLKAKSVFIAARIGKSDATEGGTFPTQSGFTYRQIGIIKNPYKYGTTDVAVSDTLQWTYALTITSGSGPDFIPGENVTQTNGSGDVVFSGVVTDSSSNNTIQVTQTVGTPVTQQTIVGENANIRSVTSYIPPTAARGSGEIIYLENIAPLSRDAYQSEVFRFVFNF